MSDKFSIAELETFSKKISSLKFKNLYNKVYNFVYPQLKNNPYFGPNIKRLKGSLDVYYRYRIGNYRLFYKIDKDKLIVFIFDIKPRKDSYKKRK